MGREEVDESRWSSPTDLSLLKRGCSLLGHTLLWKCLSNAVGPSTGRYLTHCLLESKTCSSCPQSSLGEVNSEVMCVCLSTW